MPGVSARYKSKSFTNIRAIPASYEFCSESIDADSASVTPIKVGFTADRARMYLALCALLNGSNYVFTKLLQEAVPNALLTCLRFVFASLLFIPSLTKYKRHRNVIRGAVQIGITQAVGFISQVIALKHFSASKVAFFSSLSVVLCPLLDAVVGLHNRVCNITKPPVEPVPGASLAAPLMAIVGVAFLEFGGMDPVHWTDLLMLVTPLAFASGYRKSEALVRAHPGAVHFNTGVQMVTVSTVSLAWALAAGQLPVTRRAAGSLLRRLSSWRLGLLHAGLVTTAWTQLTEQKGACSLGLTHSRAVVPTCLPFYLCCSHSRAHGGGHGAHVHARAALRGRHLDAAAGRARDGRNDRRGAVHHGGVCGERARAADSGTVTATSTGGA